MKYLLSQVGLAPRPSCILVHHIVNDLIHAFLVGLEDLDLLLHQPCLLKQQWLWNDVASIWGLELISHLRYEAVHLLICDRLQLSLMMLHNLLRWCFCLPILDNTAAAVIGLIYSLREFHSVIDGGSVELHFQAKLFLRELLFWNDARICHK